MFVRVKQTPNSPRKSVQIVKSVRIDGKVVQRIVRYVGVAMDETELNKMLDIAEFIKARIEHETSPTLFGPEKAAELAIEGKRAAEREDETLDVDLKELKEEQRVITGIHEVYGQVYQEIGFDRVLSPSRHGRSATNVLHHIVMARIANPSSKRSAVLNLETDFGVQLNLTQVYRMMDKLDENAVKRMETCAFDATRQVLGEDIDVVFVDATTLYFESFKEDEFKQNGYSKDLKFNQPQVLLALMVTKQGLPVGYEAFPGSTYEGHTLLPLLDKIKKRFSIDKVVFVADSALLSDKNLGLLEEAGYEYIVGARLRNTTKAVRDQILDPSNYKECEEDIKCVEIEKANGRRLVVTHSQKRARKDQHDREKAVNKLLAKLGEAIYTLFYASIEKTVASDPERAYRNHNLIIDALKTGDLTFVRKSTMNSLAYWMQYISSNQK